MSKAVSTVEAGRLLGVHRVTVARYIRQGLIHGYRAAPGKRWRVSLASVLALKGEAEAA